MKVNDLPDDKYAWLSDVQVIPLGRTRYRLKHPAGMIDCDWARDNLLWAINELAKGLNVDEPKTKPKK